MTTITRDAEGTVTGNTYDKYGSSNPVVKKLMAGFERTLDELWAKASPRSVLDVGCGEGVLTHKWAQRLRDGRIVGIDLEDPAIQAEWAKRQAPNLEYKIMKAETFPFADGEFELASAIEVLEHVPDPEHTVVRDGARGARRAPAGQRPARADVARPEHGPRRLHQGPREHARAPEPLVAQGVRRVAEPPREGRGDPLAVPVDHAARQGVN